MEEKLNDQELEKVSGGKVINDYTDPAGNRHIVNFGVLDLCVGCGACVNKCPMQAIRIVGNVATINESDCILCYYCVDACYLESILEKETIIPPEPASAQQS